MRDIKFRVWGKRTKILDRVDTLSFAPDGRVTLIVFDDDVSTDAEGFDLRKDYIIEQFTGLHDADGREIWEGDVVEFSFWWFDGSERESLLRGTIVYSDANMSYQLKGVKNKEWEEFRGYEGDTEYLTPFSELNFEEADFRVIGNIHESGTPDGDSNPEAHQPED